MTAEPTEEECVYLLSLVVRLCTLRGVCYLDVLRFVQAMPYPQLAAKFVDPSKMPEVLAEIRGRLDAISPPDATEVARLRTLLADLEWKGDSVNENCPCCRNHSCNGHAPDCYLKAALDGR